MLLVVLEVHMICVFGYMIKFIQSSLLCFFGSQRIACGIFFESRYLPVYLVFGTAEGTTNVQGCDSCTWFMLLMHH